MPEEALEVVKAWGFTLKTMKGFTWHKTTKHGKSHFGMGHWTRANTEDCLFAVRGKPKRANADVRQFIEAPRGRHSAKPDEVRERLVRLMGDVPRLEMFAREAIPGWDVWGNEVESTIEFLGEGMTTDAPETALALRRHFTFTYPSGTTFDPHWPGGATLREVELRIPWRRSSPSRTRG